MWSVRDQVPSISSKVCQLSTVACQTAWQLISLAVRTRRDASINSNKDTKTVYINRNCCRHCRTSFRLNLVRPVLHRLRRDCHTVKSGLCFLFFAAAPSCLPRPLQSSTRVDAIGHPSKTPSSSSNKWRRRMRMVVARQHSSCIHQMTERSKLQRKTRQFCPQQSGGLIYKNIVNILSYDKTIARSTYNMKLKHTKISLRNIVS